MAGRLVAGIDVGSSYTKAIVLAEGGEIRGTAVTTTGVDFRSASAQALMEALRAAGADASQVPTVVSSGYGRHHVPSRSKTKTEIACHARGAYHFFNDALTVVDIGGQDNKIIKVNAKGEVIDFKMNRKCSAGTGLFLEEVAHRMGIPIGEMNGLAESTTDCFTIGSFCTVFAAAEVLAAARKGMAIPSIVRGAFKSMVDRVMEIDPLEGRVVVTGGVAAHNPVFSSLLSATLNRHVEVPQSPQLMGALGAALYGVQEYSIGGIE